MAPIPPLSLEFTMPEVVYKSLEFMGYPEYLIGDDGSLWRKLGDGPFEKMKFRSTMNLTDYSKPRIKLASGWARPTKGFHAATLILTVFEGEKPGCKVGFRNGDKRDRRLSNLYWKEPAPPKPEQLLVSDVYRTVGSVVKAARQQKGMTAEQAAKACKVQLLSWQAFEFGQAGLPLSIFLKACAALDLKLEEVLPADWRVAVMHVKSGRKKKRGGEPEPQPQSPSPSE